MALDIVVAAAKIDAERIERVGRADDDALSTGVMPEVGPMPNGSGAAWFFDLRWFHSALTEKLTSSPSS